MAGKGSIRADCRNSSNPYHVCSEYCFEKKGESKTHKAGKHSGYDGDSKKMVRPDCGKRSNPYHNCNEFCSNRSTQSSRPETKKNSGSVVTDLSKTIAEKKSSRPKPPQELDLPLSNGISSMSHMSKPQVSSKEKADSRNGDYIEPYAEETKFAEPIKEQNKFSHLILVSGNVSKPADKFQDVHKNVASSNFSVQPKRDSEIRPHEFPELVLTPFPDKEEDDCAHSSPNIANFHLTVAARNCEESDDEEIKSVSSESSVSVGKYRIKANFASILESIFDKYGDITASCKLESLSIRSYYLSCVCYIVQELQCTKFPHMSNSKVKELLAILNDVESSEINVSWLRSILDEVAEAIKFSSEHWSVEAAKVKYDRELESTKKELESQMNYLTMKEKEVADAKARVADTRAHLSELELKYSQLNEAMSSVRLKVNDLQCKALTDELL